EGFDHNSQTLRIVDELERYDPSFAGLNLTWEVREGSAKHKTLWRVRSVAEFNDAGAHPSLEAQVADLADEIAYTCHDLDDGIRSGYLSFEALDRPELWLWGDTLVAVDRDWPGLEPALRRKQVVRRLINRLVTDLIDATARQLQATGITSVEGVRCAEAETACFSTRVAEGLRALKQYLLRELYHHYQ